MEFAGQAWKSNNFAIFWAVNSRNRRFSGVERYKESSRHELLGLRLEKLRYVAR
jgi:hypothetical protein